MSDSSDENLPQQYLESPLLNLSIGSIYKEETTHYEQKPTAIDFNFSWQSPIIFCGRQEGQLLHIPI